MSSSATTKCPMCNGIGKHLTAPPVAGAVVSTTNCPVCGGSGQLDSAKAAGFEALVQGKAVAAPEAPAPTPSAPQGLVEGLKATGKMVGSAVIQAAEQEVAAQIGAGMVTAAKAALGDKYPRWLDNTAGDTAMASLLPLGVLLLTNAYGESVPYANLLKQGAEMALKGTSQTAVKEAVKVALPFLKDVALLSAGLLQQRMLGGKEQEQLTATLSP